MGISVHSVETVPRYTADTVGRVTISVYYLVMHTHMKPDSTVDTLWVLHVCASGIVHVYIRTCTHVRTFLRHYTVVVSLHTAVHKVVDV